jgi:phasin
MQGTPFDIPDQMREAADRSLEQAKKAIGQFMDATQAAVARAEGSAHALREGAGDVQRQAMAYVEENIASAFDFAERLVKARSLEEVAAIQQEFVRRQAAAATEQGRSLGTMMGRGAGQPEKDGKGG